MNLRDIISKVAPVLGTALGGPLGGAALGAIAKALGAKEQTQDAVLAAVKTMTPEQAVALEMAEKQFALDQIKELNRSSEELERIHSTDRDSARKREISVKDLTPSILAGFVTFGFFAVLIYMMSEEIPASGKDALLIMLGALGAAFTGIIAYYFGSSSGSARKTQLLSEKAP